MPNALHSGPLPSPSAACTSLTAKLSALRDDRAATIGRLAEHKVVKQLANQVRTRVDAGQLNPNYYAKSNASAALATSAIDNAAAGIKTSSPPAPKTIKRNDLPLLNATGVANADGDWVLTTLVKQASGDSIDLPDYVVVIDKGGVK